MNNKCKCDTIDKLNGDNSEDILNGLESFDCFQLALGIDDKQLIQYIRSWKWLWFGIGNKFEGCA